jgi:hypothetical protein
MDPKALLDKILRLARLDTTVFDEVRDDPNELIPATIVTVVSAMLAGLGAMLFYMVNSVFGSEDPEGLFLRTFLMGGIFLGMLYLGWILIAYVVLVQIFKASADLQSLMRTLGYAALPLSLSLLMFIPVLGPVFAIVPMGLLFVFTIYATQAVTNADSTQVVIANAAGFAAMVLVLGIIATTGDVPYPDAPIGAGIFSWILPT